MTAAAADSADGPEATLERSLRFRNALASFPSGVTIVTTSVDEEWWGFTATSFCSVSVEPPLVLVCLAKSAQCYTQFMTAPKWIVNFVPSDHADLAQRFATRGAEKFVEGHFTANEAGLPVLDRAIVVLECDSYARYDGGDHTILVGRVTESHVSDDAPAIYFRRDYHSLPF
ncbi:MAG: flavin reductase domain protein FMN-binding [Pseudonocardiales bacterium]|nr:flavin reductase domain protein FMN-binding [Pseudonocardiales bacterium]